MKVKKSKTETQEKKLTPAQRRKVEQFKKRLAADELNRNRGGFLPHGVEIRC